MAKADYILCEICDCKVIYDGYWNARDNWTNETWPLVVCGECAKDRRIAAAVGAVKDDRKSKQHLEDW